MLNPFWNSSERRLRFTWRLILQTLLWLLPYGLLTGLAIAVMHLFTAASATWLDAISPLLTAASMIFSVWISGKYLDHRRFSDFGFHFNPAWYRDFGFGLGLGVLLMVFIFLVELAGGWIRVDGFFQSNLPDFSFIAGILTALVSFLCVGVYEELWIRGYLLHNLAEGLNFKFLSPGAAVLAAYVISSLIYGILHGANPNATVLSSASIAAAGLFLGLGFILTGDLAIPIGIHITWNFFEGNVFGFPVSGLNSAATFIHVSQSGPVIWTGGAFGPEAGLIGLAAISLGCLLTLGWLRWSGGKLSLYKRLAQYQPPNGGDGDPQETASPNNYP
jgi:membrane protease YdiL (CAAX protease family)